MTMVDISTMPVIESRSRPRLAGSATSASRLQPDPLRRAVQDDLLRAVRCMLLHEHRDQNALVPGTVRDPFDFWLPGGEPSVSVFGVEDEAAKVSVAIVDEHRHLAGE